VDTLVIPASAKQDLVFSDKKAVSLAIETLQPANSRI
jgi:hypothetical protein